MKTGKFLLLSLVMAVLFMSTTVVFAAGDVFEWGNDKQPVETQGANGWYYMYSTQHNEGNIDTNALKQCKWGSDAWSGWMGPVWVPNDEDLVDFYAANPGNNWFYIAKDGTVAPGGDCTAALKWEAQQDGQYKITASYEGGARMSDADEKADGVTFYVYQGTTQLSKNNSARSHVTGTVDKTVNLKSGDPLFFISDPNGNFGYDEGKWIIKVERIGEYAEATPAPTATAEPTTAPTAAPTSATTSAPTQNPATGDSGMATAVALILISGSALIFIVRKRAHI